MENISPQLANLLFILLGAFLVSIKDIVLYFARRKRQKKVLKDELNRLYDWLLCVIEYLCSVQRTMKKQQPLLSTLVLFSSAPTKLIKKMIDEGSVYKIAKNHKQVNLLDIVYHDLQRPDLQEGYDSMHANYQEFQKGNIQSPDDLAVYNDCLSRIQMFRINIEKHRDMLKELMQDCGVKIVV